MRIAGGVALVALVSGCVSSAPLRYYTLSEVPPATEASSPANAASGIRVGRVRIPGELDRTELVQRIDATRVKIAEQDRWAAPLDEMIRRVLSADLQSRASGTSETPSTLSVDVEELIGDASCEVTLRASWELKSTGTSTAPARTGHESIRQSASSGTCSVGALPMAMSQALAQLSDRILAAAR
jgi:uncharacterized lipoprotein YmbA